MLEVQRPAPASADVNRATPDSRDELRQLRAQARDRAARIQHHLGAARRLLERLHQRTRDLEDEAQAQTLVVATESGGQRESHDPFDPLQLERYSRLQELAGGLEDTLGHLLVEHERLECLADESQFLLARLDRPDGAMSPADATDPHAAAPDQVLLVGAAGHVFALALQSVDAIIDAENATYGKAYEQAGRHYEWLDLTLALGLADIGDRAQKPLPVVLVRCDQKCFALCVDEVQGTYRARAQTIGKPLDTMAWLSAATVLANGRVALIPRLEMLADLAPHGTRRGRILVVDDSLTIRKMTEAMLQRNAMSATTANDGVDALSAMQDEVPAMVLLDIEMPRMDGFELAAAMRADDRLHSVPIIMISSRTGKKHRDQAAALGVNGFLAKPYDEARLLAAIRELTDVSG